MLFQIIQKKSGFDSALDYNQFLFKKNKSLEILQNNRSHKKMKKKLEF